MELDDLKQIWQEQKPDVSEALDVQNIIDMIQNKNYGPIASLKSELSKSFLGLGILFTSGVYLFRQQTMSYTDKGLFFFLIIILIPRLLLNIYWYFTVNKFQNAQNPLGKTLKNVFSKMKLSIEICSVFTFIGCAILYLWLDKTVVSRAVYGSNLYKWGQIGIYYRYAVYIVFFIISYYFSKKSIYRHFGKHIEYVKSLIDQL